jgi:hypothetical protein
MFVRYLNDFSTNHQYERINIYSHTYDKSLFKSSLTTSQYYHNCVAVNINSVDNDIQKIRIVVINSPTGQLIIFCVDPIYVRHVYEINVVQCINPCIILIQTKNIYPLCIDTTLIYSGTKISHIPKNERNECSVVFEILSQTKFIDNIIGIQNSLCMQSFDAESVIDKNECKIALKLMKQYKRCNIFLDMTEQFRAIQYISPFIQNKYILFYSIIFQKLYNSIYEKITKLIYQNPHHLIWSTVSMNLLALKERSDDMFMIDIDEYLLSNVLYNEHKYTSYYFLKEKEWRVVELEKYIWPQIVCRQYDLYYFVKNYAKWFGRKINKFEILLKHNDNNYRHHYSKNNTKAKLQINYHPNDQNKQNRVSQNISKYDIVEDIYGNFGIVCYVYVTHYQLPIIVKVQKIPLKSNHKKKFRYLCEQEIHKIIRGNPTHSCANVQCKSKNNIQYHRCKGCFLVSYCSYRCAKIHWKMYHRYICKNISNKFLFSGYLWK